MSSEDHEKVSIYPFSDEKREELLSKARECVFNWTTKDGWAVGVVHAFVWHEGRAWITCGAHRHRVSAIRRDPRCSVVVSGLAAPDGPNGAITIKGRAIIHDDEETKRWFYPALIVPAASQEKADELAIFGHLFEGFACRQRLVKRPGPQGVRVDVDSGDVWVDGELAPDLTDLEYRLLLLLYGHLDRLCDRYQIVESVWGQDYIDEVDDARIGKLVNRLRQKIEPDPSEPRYLITVRGRGYRLVIP